MPPAGRLSRRARRRPAARPGLRRAVAAVAAATLLALTPACRSDATGSGGDGGDGAPRTTAPSPTDTPAGDGATTEPGGAGAPSTVSPPAAGRTLVVAPSGRDGGLGTEASPWATLGHALARLEAGDTLLVRGGRYRERLTSVALREGRPDARVTVAAFPGERPVLEGLLWLDRPSHWTVRGLEVAWGGTAPDQPMVRVVDGVGWRLEANRLSGARSIAALVVTGSRSGEPAGWAVAGNCVHDTVRTNDKNEDRLVVVDPGLEAGPGVVERNLLFGARNGAGLELGGTGAGARGAAGVTVRHNTIYDTAQSIVVAGRSRDNQIVANLLGRTSEEYATIRGYRLEGAGNQARDNVGFQSIALILNDQGFRGVEPVGDNRIPVDPRFDAVDGCGAFRPGNPEVGGAGHLAP
ncbi:MAG TPA: hypothetical protein VFO65_05840 [Acidimicrobiales bacterium]|nr:hypothetical protein [Acidimicrobiales bacterium]